MELEEFISKTLISIASGVHKANEGVKELNLGGNPVFVVEPASNHNKRSDGYIEFDVAVTATTEGASTISGGIRVWSIGVDGQKEVKEADQIVSRIKFGIAPYTTIA